MAYGPVSQETKLYHADTREELADLAMNQGFVPCDTREEAMEGIPAEARYVLVTTFEGDIAETMAVGLIVWMDESMNVVEAFTA